MNLSVARARMIARQHGRTSDEGLTLIEVIVAFVILMIAIIPMSYLLTTAVASATQARQREAAIQLADSWVEILSNTSPPTYSDGTVYTGHSEAVASLVPAGVQTPKSTLSDTTFAVTALYTNQAVDNLGQSDLCSDGQPPSPTHPGVIQLQVTVTWGLGQSLTDTTNIDYPQPGLQTQGFLGVQLSNDGLADFYGNSASDRLEAVPVSIEETSPNPTLSPNPIVLQPDQNGCVFTQVPQGTYSVSLGQPVAGTPATFTGYNANSPAFVTTSGSTTDTATATVTETAETVVQMTAFDEGINTSISYGGSAAVDRGVECPGTTVLTCVTTGNGASQASAAWGGTSANWSSTTFANVSNILQVACTSASSPTCVGVGYGPSGGVILTTQAGLGTVSTDALPSSAGVSEVTQVTCPTANGCYAIGTTASGPVLLAGAVGQTAPQQDTWAVVAPTSTTFTSLSSIACPMTTTCELAETSVVGTASAAPGILRLDGDPATLATNSAWVPTFTLDSAPTNLVTSGQVTCPTSSQCLLTGVVNEGVANPLEPTVLAAAISATVTGNPPPSSSWSVESTFPTTGVGSVSGISCTSTNCMAVGTASGVAAVWTADLTENPDDWAQASLPTSLQVQAVSSVACGNPTGADTASCVVAANTTGASSPGQLLVGSLTGGSWAWNSAIAPAGTVDFFTGVACEAPPSPSASACAAVGATPSGPVILTSANGPQGTWTAQTPSSLPGATVTGIPLEIAPATTSSWTTPVAAGGTTNATTLGMVLYPWASGYSLVAGDCSAEATNFSTTTLSAAPGGPASAVVPLGLAALKLVTTSGAPVSGATITLTSTSCGANGDTYVLPVTDPAGFTRTAVPYGTYSYTVNSGGMAAPADTITVGASSLVLTTSTPTTTTAYLPSSLSVPS